MLGKDCGPRAGDKRRSLMGALLVALLALTGCSFGRNQATPVQAQALATAIPATTPRPRGPGLPAPPAGARAPQNPRGGGGF